MVLKFTATGVIAVALPKLPWSWYAKEDTVVQARRLLVEYCRPRISRMVANLANLREIIKAA